MRRNELQKRFPLHSKKIAGTSIMACGFSVRAAAPEDRTMRKSIIFIAVGLSMAATAASAEETRIGVGVGPVGAGVTVGQSPSYERRTTVIKEREPRDETVVIRKERREPRDKVIIHERD
jgi:hypothetical protein